MHSLQALQERNDLKAARALSVAGGVFKCCPEFSKVPILGALSQNTSEMPCQKRD